MAVEKTFSIIKPDAVAKNVIGDIVSRFEKAGLRIIASRMLHLSEKEAQGFYAELQRGKWTFQLVGDGIDEAGLAVDHANLAHKENAEEHQDGDDHREGYASESDQRGILTHPFGQVEILD